MGRNGPSGDYTGYFIQIYKGPDLTTCHGVLIAARLEASCCCVLISTVMNALALGPFLPCLD